MSRVGLRPGVTPPYSPSLCMSLGSGRSSGAYVRLPLSPGVFGAGAFRTGRVFVGTVVGSAIATLPKARTRATATRMRRSYGLPRRSANYGCDTGAGSLTQMGSLRHHTAARAPRRRGTASRRRRSCAPSRRAGERRREIGRGLDRSAGATRHDRRELRSGRARGPAGSASRSTRATPRRERRDDRRRRPCRPTPRGRAPAAPRSRASPRAPRAVRVVRAVEDHVADALEPARDGARPRAPSAGAGSSIGEPASARIAAIAAAALRALVRARQRDRRHARDRGVVDRPSPARRPRARLDEHRHRLGLARRADRSRAARA